MPDTEVVNQNVRSEVAEIRLVCIVLFLIGLLISGGWVMVAADSGARTDRLTQLTISMDDKACDSGFKMDWLDGASLIDFNGKKISEISFDGVSADCSVEYDFIYLSLAVEPTANWIYRLSIPNANDSGSRQFIASESLDPLGGPAQVFFALSLDCSAGARVCL
jgi:hypothetical protein